MPLRAPVQPPLESPLGQPLARSYLPEPPNLIPPFALGPNLYDSAAVGTPAGIDSGYSLFPGGFQSLAGTGRTRTFANIASAPDLPLVARCNVDKAGVTLFPRDGADGAGALLDTATSAAPGLLLSEYQTSVNPHTVLFDATTGDFQVSDLHVGERLITAADARYVVTYNADGTITVDRNGSGYIAFMASLSWPTEIGKTYRVYLPNLTKSHETHQTRMSIAGIPAVFDNVSTFEFAAVGVTSVLGFAPTNSTAATMTFDPPTVWQVD